MNAAEFKKYFYVFEGLSGYYLFQVKTFNIYEIDEITYRYLVKVQVENNETHEFSISEELDSLFYSDIKNAEYSRVLQEVGLNYRRDVPEVNSLNIYLSGECNLSCSYCYTNDSIQSGGKQAKSIEPDVGYKAIDFYFNSVKHSGRLPAINFFGGEPLLFFDKIRGFVEYAVNHRDCVNKQVSFYTTTNATLLNSEMINFFKKYDFNIVVSIDGNKEVHDRHRKYSSGKGSYTTAWKNLRLLSKACPGNVRIRSTICPAYTKVDKIVEHFRTSGVGCYGFELMYDIGGSDDFKWTDNKITEYKINFRKYISSIYNMIIENKITAAESASLMCELMKLWNKQRQYLPCQMGMESITISGDGYIYPCHWLVDSKNWRIGSLDDGFFEEREKSYPDLVFENAICKNCWVRFLCGGGCPSISIRNNNSKSKPDIWMCKDKKIHWDGYLALYAELLKHNDTFFAHAGERL